MEVFKPHGETPEKVRDRDDGKRFLIEVCGRDRPAPVTPDGVRAVTRGKAVDPARVEVYLRGTFGDDLPAVRAALRKFTRSLSPPEFAGRGYPFSERFRPEVSDKEAGWGAKGVLDLDGIADLAAEARTREPSPTQPRQGRCVPGEPTRDPFREAAVSALVRVYSDFA